MPPPSTPSPTTATRCRSTAGGRTSGAPSSTTGGCPAPACGATSCRSSRRAASTRSRCTSTGPTTRPARGQFDFSGVRDVDRLLRMAQEAGLYVIARPGPYINAETDGGGFPAWVNTLAGRSRSSRPTSGRGRRVAAPHRPHHRPPPVHPRRHVILYQLENEYGIDTDPAYMTDISSGDGARRTASPCRSPTTSSCGDSTWANGRGAVDLVGKDSYPQGFDCSHPERWGPRADTLALPERDARSTRPSTRAARSTRGAARAMRSAGG